MTGSTRCVVVGGGPAGMVLGLLLARAGVDVTVLEKHADFLRDFRGDTVHPSTLTLLDELGLGGWFEELPHSRVERVELPAPGGRTTTVADLSRLRVAHPYIALAPQWDLLDLLAEAASREPSFRLATRHEVTGLVRENGRVAGVVHRGPDGREATLRAGLVVAADGRHSTVRRAAGLRSTSFPVPFDAWWFRLPRADGETEGTLAPSVAPGRFAVAIPRVGYHQIAALAPKGVDLRRRGLAAFRRDIALLYPRLADRVGALESMDEVAHLDVRMDRLRRWHTEGLLCIGDAAHAMSPVGGVGINLAVQDAVAAAALLARPLRRGRVPGEELARVRARRLAPVAAAQSLQRMMHRAFIGPALAGRRGGPPPALTAVLDRFPALTAAPAHLVGVGLRPEH
ncbi:FAD-dependent oxidoreductase, partial [Streptomyces fuscigenes]|uniref:FAD-dependent oxidoreductase n=1 Tax=Streptomyces fuscigenes TaxID=1528880 RepID=UPI001F340E9E